MPLNLLLAWWNLIYILPFALALTYLGLFVFTGITFGDVDADADMDADTSLHVEAHVADVHTGPELGAGPDADVDADADADADADGDHDAGLARGGLVHTQAMPGILMPHMAQDASVDHEAAGATTSPFVAFLTLLGIGKVPVSLALMILLMSWGLVGFALNALFVQWVGATGFVSVISVPLTLAISLTLTGLCAAVIAKIIPSDEGTRERRQDLVGKAGEAMFEINESFGMAKVRGNAGDFYQVPCRTVAGKPPIAKGTLRGGTAVGRWQHFDGHGAVFAESRDATPKQWSNGSGFLLTIVPGADGLAHQVHEGRGGVGVAHAVDRVVAAQDRRLQLEWIEHVRAQRVEVRPRRDAVERLEVGAQRGLQVRRVRLVGGTGEL